MPRNAHAPLLKRSLVQCLVLLLTVVVRLSSWAAQDTKRSFDVAAANAAESLQRFATQAGRQIIFPSDTVSGITTNAVKGTFTPREAIEQLVANTGLVAVEDARTGALIVYQPGPPPRSGGRAQAVPNAPAAAKDPLAPPKPKKSVLASALGALMRQAEPTPTTSTGASDDMVRLDPFNVSAQSDVGFVAANSLAGGRMTTPLKDTPVAYSVLTSEFLEAFNIIDAGKAAEFTVNANQYYNDGLNGTQGNTLVTVRIRGQTANSPTRNFFPYAIAADSYNVDRIDFARGANASLFGAGAAAGTQNAVSKQALLTKTIREIRLQVGSWDRFRLTADVNEPITDRLAVRTNLLWSTGNTWRDREWERRKGIDLAATWHITPLLSLRTEYEFRTTDKSTGTNRTKDNTSAWDGKFMPTGPNPAMTAAEMAVAGVTRGTQRFVIDPDNPLTASNIANLFQTKGAAYSPTGTNYLAGQPIRSVGFSLSNVSMTEVWDHPMRFAASYAGSPFFLLPRKSFTPLWDKDYRYPNGTERARDFTVYLTYRPFEGFFGELSLDRNQVDRWTEYTANGGMYAMQIDINRLKSNGTPNRLFLHPYSENTPFAFYRNPRYRNLNLQLAYVKNSRWGQLQVGVLGGLQHLQQQNRQAFFLLPLFNGVIPGADIRSFFEPADTNPQSVYTRQYTDLRGQLPSRHPSEEALVISDGTRGTRAVMAPKWYVQPNRPGFTDDIEKKFRFAQAMVNLNLFSNHVVFIGAVRRDLTLLRDELFKYSYDMPADWDGSYVTHRPSAPDDYWFLQYTPKDTSGRPTGAAIPAAQRPRTVINGVSVPLPQYAGDRFQDDFSPRDVRRTVKTQSVGSVINLTNWFGIYVNDSTTFDLNAANLDARQQLIPPTSSNSLDAGLRFNLPNGHLNFSLGWYRAYQEGQPYNVGFDFLPDINDISDAPVVGDLSAGGRNLRGLARFPGLNVFSTLTSETDGYEGELTANLTRNWRIIVNAGRNRPVQKDVMPDLPRWIAEKDIVLRQILGDAGVLINAQNQGFINPAFNDPTKINVERVQRSVTAWNDYQTVGIPAILATRATPARQTGGPDFTANLATDYRISRGWARGLRAGIAINYRGRQILGARTADTIVDPQNPTRAVPAPGATATNYLWAGGYAKGSANFSYTWRINEEWRRFTPKSIQLDLAIDNLFGLSRPLIENSTTNNSTANGVTLAPRNNDISNPAVVSIPGGYNFQPPRSYTLTVKLNF